MKLLFPRQNYIVLSPSPTLIYLWEVYIFPGSVCLFCCREIQYVDQSWEYINPSQTHECRSCDSGRTMPRKGIHKWDFPWIGCRYSIEPMVCEVTFLESQDTGLRRKDCDTKYTYIKKWMFSGQTRKHVGEKIIVWDVCKISLWQL